MKTLLSQIDVVIECRDYRIPLTSRNPLLEDGLRGKERIIVYTKHDLGEEVGERRKVQKTYLSTKACIHEEGNS